MATFEIEEIEFLNKTIKALIKKIDGIEIKLASVKKDFDEAKKTLSDDFYYIDKEGSLGQTYSNISKMEERVNSLSHEHHKLLMQAKSPYFARIDFTPNGDNTAQKIYIGISNVVDGTKVLVADWRAPVSSMYYDFSLGQASFSNEEETTHGNLSLKRQYKIENKELISYFDTDLTIQDDILKEVLSHNSSSKMKQIVSSIQKEQNEIVRTEKYDNILVQGVAGSGKTSIALHRAAYLLYKHRKSLKSSDIIILSPNSIFSSYISNVLPELGEDNLAETTFESIARAELHRPLQSREAMLDEIATTQSQEKLNEISFKSSFDYLEALLSFLEKSVAETFTPKTLSYEVGLYDDDKYVFTQEQTSELFFKAFKGLPVYKRIEKIAWQYAMFFTEKRHYNKEQFSGLKERFKKILYNFLPLKDVDKLFEIFLARCELSAPKGDQISYMDKGALLAIKHYLYGFEHDFSAKYLIIDEMQDFTPVDLYLFKKLWSCPSIILGDINQCIEKCLNEDYLKDVSSLLGSHLFQLKKTYRSTKEIATFAHKLIDLNDIEYVNRSGDAPKLIKSDDQVKEIVDIVKENDNFAHIAIVCKCEKERDELAKALKGKLDFKVIKEAEDYNNKVLLTTCATAKGIEFDCVIVPNADADNYANSLEKNILYVSSTRALHKLFFIYSSTPSKFLNKAQNKV